MKLLSVLTPKRCVELSVKVPACWANIAVLSNSTEPSCPHVEPDQLKVDEPLISNVVPAPMLTLPVTVLTADPLMVNVPLPVTVRSPVFSAPVMVMLPASRERLPRMGVSPVKAMVASSSSPVMATSSPASGSRPLAQLAVSVQSPPAALIQLTAIGEYVSTTSRSVPFQLPVTV